MKAIFMAIGSRGDIEPFLALAEILHAKGWGIVCVFPEQFRDAVEQEGYAFYGFEKEYLEIFVESREGNIIMGGEGSFFKRAIAIYKMMKGALKLGKGVIQLQRDAIKIENPDLVFYHRECHYPFIWSIQNPKKSILVNLYPFVIHPVAYHSVIQLKGGRNYGKFVNKCTYKLSNFIKAVFVKSITKKFQKELVGHQLSIGTIQRFMLQKQRSFYTISPTLFHKPTNWHDGIEVVGYYERKRNDHWQPAPELLRFLENNKRIVFISFGSMSNSNPIEKTAILLNVLEKHKIAAIIGTSWGGLQKPENHPAHFFFIEKIPYEWLFPKVTAVVHHGGSGTTHTGLKHGCPTLIIPHFIDQFFWNDKVAEVGVGPRGVSMKELTEAIFEDLILNLLKNDTYQLNAQLIAKQMELESDIEELLKKITL